MKNYICLNHGECSWADERPPRVFSLSEGEENVCPNCESANIKDAVPPKSSSGRIVVIAGALVLLAAITWLIWFQSQPPLELKAEMNCETGLITLTSTGGNEEPIAFSADGLSPGQENNTFKVPRNRRKGSTFTFHAEQSGNTVETTFTTSCVTISKPQPPSPLFVPDPTGNKNNTPVITWTRVPNSEFCDDLTECIQVYSEKNNLGQIRERRIENCTECAKAKAGN